MACVLVLSAVAAQSAAAISGTTAFTCQKTEAGGAGFSKSHCRAADAVASGAQYAHLAIAQDKPTELKISNETTGGETESLVLKPNNGSFELKAATVAGEGEITNSLDASQEHYVRGGALIKLTKVTLIPVSFVFTGCKIFSNDPKTNEPGVEGEIDLEPLSLTTTKQGDSLKLAPTTGEAFAKFWIKECSLTEPQLEHQYTLTGSLSGSPDGATLNFTHAKTTEQKSLKINTVVFGVAGSLTLSGKSPGEGGSFTPLSFTTVETP